MVLRGLLAPAAARWTRNKSRGQEKQAAGQLGLSRYGPQVMSVLCLCTTVHQTGQNNNQASKILPNTSPISSEEESINSLQEIPTDELALLAKLEEANRLIESDAKSLNSLQSNHSRKGSDATIQLMVKRTHGPYGVTLSLIGIIIGRRGKNSSKN